MSGVAATPPGLRPSGAEPQDASQAEPLVPNAVCTIAHHKGYLDHLARFGCDVRRRAWTNNGRVMVDGSTADEAGSLGLIELATEIGKPVTVDGFSEYHNGKTFEPRVTAASGDAQ